MPLAFSQLHEYMILVLAIFTDRIRSMWEGNVFIHVCLSVCSTLGGGSHVTFPQSFGATLYKHVHQARPIILVSGEQR